MTYRFSTKQIAALGLLLVGSLVWGACGGAAAPTPTRAPAASPTPTARPQPTPTPVPAGPRGKVTISVANMAEEEVDPIYNQTNGNWPYTWVLSDALTVADVDTAARLPAIATKWSMAPDGKAWTYTLRQGVPFYDGTIVAIAGPAVADIKSAGFRLVASKATANLELAILAWPVEKEHPIRNKLVRQAIAYALDRDGIIKSVYLGEGTPQSVGDFAYYTFGFDPSLKPYPYDRAKAKALLAQAGYPNGFNLTLGSYESPSTALIPQAMEAVQAMLKDIGINATIGRGEYATYYADWRAHTPKADIGPLSYTGLTEVSGYLDIFLNKGKAYSYWDMPQFEAMWKAQSVELDAAKREAMLKEMTRFLYDELPLIPILHANTIYGIGPKVASWTPETGMAYAARLELVRLK